MKTEQLTKLLRIISLIYVAAILASSLLTWRYPERTDYFGPGLLVFAVLIIGLGALIDRSKGTKIDLPRKIVYIIALISLVFIFASRLVTWNAEYFNYLSAGWAVFVVLLLVLAALMMRNKATKIDQQQKIVYIIFPIFLAVIFASTLVAGKYPDHTDYVSAGLAVFVVLLLVVAALMFRKRAT